MSLLSSAKTVTQEVVADLAPQDDLLPMLIYSGRCGDCLLGLAIDPDESLYIPYIVANLVVDEAREAAYVSCVWMSYNPDFPPEQDPDHQEAVCIAYAGPDGGVAYTSSLTRHDNISPTMGKWEEMSMMDGRIANALREGIHIAGLMPEDLRELVRTIETAGERNGAISGVMRAMIS